MTNSYVGFLVPPVGPAVCPRWEALVCRRTRDADTDLAGREHYPDMFSWLSETVRKKLVKSVEKQLEKAYGPRGRVLPRKLTTGSCGTSVTTPLPGGTKGVPRKGV